MAKSKHTAAPPARESTRESTRDAKDATREAASGRGSPEAIQKRRVARRLNDLLMGRKAVTNRLDGRTEKRRRRLLAELDKGTKNPEKGLKPIDVLRRVHDLLELGEPMGSIRKVARVRPNTQIDLPAATQILRELHQAYQFRAEAYRFLGLPHEALVEAKITEQVSPRRGRPPRGARRA